MVHLNAALSEGIVALSDELLAPFIIAVGIQFFICNHMNNVLKDIFINSNRL